jgi:staphylococcal nuclease domain-containing protein 1
LLPLDNRLKLTRQWHAGLLAPHGGLDRLRAAEKTAKDKRLGVWANIAASKASTSGGATNGSAAPATTKGASFDAIVTRVWNSDQISVIAKGDEKGVERRLQFASVRGPRGTEAKQAYYANEAKEYVFATFLKAEPVSNGRFLRKRLVGKTVHVHIDYVKPKDGEFEERECVTVTYGNSNNNIAEQLIEKGFATVLRHRRDDEDRSAELDKLIIAEQA